MDWQHEDEYRLLLMSGIDSFREAKDRKLTYDFQNLEGIIFGMRTPLKDKEHIIKIMSAKCSKYRRGTFEFGQAAYDSNTGKVKILPINLQFDSVFIDHTVDKSSRLLAQ